MNTCSKSENDPEVEDDSTRRNVTGMLFAGTEVGIGGRIRILPLDGFANRILSTAIGVLLGLRSVTVVVTLSPGPTRGKVIGCG